MLALSCPSQQSTLVCDERTVTYRNVPARTQASLIGDCVVMFGSDRDPISEQSFHKNSLSYLNGQWGPNRSRHLNYDYSDLVVSKLNKSD